LLLAAAGSGLVSGTAAAQQSLPSPDSLTPSIASADLQPATFEAGNYPGGNNVDRVWALYARAIERCGPTPTLLEWDERIPSFDAVRREARKAEPYLATARRPAEVQARPVAS
jgi:hypothetical protein